MWYVYILVCSDKKYMKIGVSGKDLKRLLTHHKTYNILIESSRFIPLTDRRLALKVESYLLGNIPKLYDVRTEDGSTELRELKWSNTIPDLLLNIKNDPIFSYADVKRMNYKLYKIGELIGKLGEYPLLDATKINEQFQILKKPSKGSVRQKKYKTEVTKRKRYGCWESTSKIVECRD